MKLDIGSGADLINLEDDFLCCDDLSDYENLNDLQKLINNYGFSQYKITDLIESGVYKILDCIKLTSFVDQSISKIYSCRFIGRVNHKYFKDYNRVLKPSGKMVIKCANYSDPLIKTILQYFTITKLEICDYINFEQIKHFNTQYENVDVNIECYKKNN